MNMDHERIDGEKLWAGVREKEVDKRIIAFLLEHQEEYRNIRQKRRCLSQKYPQISRALDTAGPITLNEEEHPAFIEYLKLGDEMEGWEREYHYYFGQADMLAYGRFLDELKESEAK